MISILTHLLILFYTLRDTHTEVSTPQHKKQWCLFLLSSLITTSYWRNTHSYISSVCRHAGDNVSVCVLLILSIVSSLIISPLPRHGHQLLKGVIIWNWFSPLHMEPGSEYKCSFGQTEEWKLMIKGCQHLKLYNSVNNCERCLLPSLSFFLLFISVLLFLPTEQLGGKAVGKLFLSCAFTCL